MSVDTDTLTGRYIYSFVRNEDCKEVADRGFVGLNDQPVEVIIVDNLGIVVSPISEGKIRPQRKLLAAHQHIVTEIAKTWNALPVAFGLVADDEESIRGLLVRNAPLLHEQLDRIEGRVEMFLSLEWSATNIFQYFIDRYPDLAQSRDYVVSGAASREEQIELGRQFENLLRTEREQITATVADALSHVCREQDFQPLRSEAEILRIACLIERSDEEAFTNAVYEAAKGFDDAFKFAFNGPWPPYSFVKLALSME